MHRSFSRPSLLNAIDNATSLPASRPKQKQKPKTKTKTKTKSKPICSLSCVSTTEAFENAILAVLESTPPVGEVLLCPSTLNNPIRLASIKIDFSDYGDDVDLTLSCCGQTTPRDPIRYKPRMSPHCGLKVTTDESTIFSGFHSNSTPTPSQQLTIANIVITQSPGFAVDLPVFGDIGTLTFSMF